MHFSTLNGFQASTLNGLAGLIKRMTLADRIKEAMGDRKPGAFAKAVGVTPGAVTQLLDGTTRSLKAETAVLMEAETGYRAHWIVLGKGPKKVGDGVPQEDQQLLDAYREVLLNLSDIPIAKRGPLIDAIQQAADASREAIAHHLARRDKVAASARATTSRSVATVSRGDGNHRQRSLPLSTVPDPFNAEPHEREAAFYRRVEKAPKARQARGDKPIAKRNRKATPSTTEKP